MIALEVALEAAADEFAVHQLDQSEINNWCSSSQQENQQAAIYSDAFFQEPAGSPTSQPGDPVAPERPQLGSVQAANSLDEVGQNQRVDEQDHLGGPLKVSKILFPLACGKDGYNDKGQ